MGTGGLSADGPELAGRSFSADGGISWTMSAVPARMKRGSRFAKAGSPSLADNLRGISCISLSGHLSRWPWVTYPNVVTSSSGG
jgi:hypothetical protein